MKTSRINAVMAVNAGYKALYGRITTAHCGISEKQDGTWNPFVSLHVFDEQTSKSAKVVVDYMAVARVLLTQDENELRASIKNVLDAVSAAKRHNDAVKDIQTKQEDFENKIMAQAEEHLFEDTFQPEKIEKLLDMNFKMLIRRKGIENMEFQNVERTLSVLMGRKALVWTLSTVDGREYLDIENGARFVTKKGGEKVVLDSIQDDDIKFDFVADDSAADNAEEAV